MSDFDWPWQYKFPPFFTVQPNIETRSKQLEAWCNLVLAYQKHAKQYNLDVTEAQNSELFFNKQLDRRLSLDAIYTVLEELRKRGRLSLDAIYTVLEELRKRGNLEWKDKERKGCTLIWRTPAEWGNMIYGWVCSKAMTNTVCTLYELTHGEDSEDQEFHQLDKAIFLRALRELQDNGKAEIINFDGNEGVKFF